MSERREKGGGGKEEGEGRRGKGGRARKEEECMYAHCFSPAAVGVWY